MTKRAQLTPYDYQLLDQLRQNPTTDTKTLAEAVGRPVRDIRRCLYRMARAGAIAPLRAAHGGRLMAWTITEGKPDAPIHPPA